MNTVPCMVPELDVMGVKLVTRYAQRTPSVDGHLLLYRYSNGQPLVLMEAGGLTALRTGTIAALAVQTFARSDMGSIGIMGLGATGRATLDCLLALYADKPLTLNLLQYKDHAQRTRGYLESISAWEIRIASSARQLFQESDAIVSCITYTTDQLAEDSDFRQGCLVVPVHTRGFQNCDLFFDKVFADDTAHVQGFRYFNRFHRFVEFPDVLAGKASCRKNNAELILSYNIVIALHDMVFAAHIHSMVSSRKYSKVGCL